MTEFKTNKLTDYIVSKILRNTIAKGVTVDNAKLSEAKARLSEEVSARLCVLPDGYTFTELVSAIEDQVNIFEYIN